MNEKDAVPKVPFGIYKRMRQDIMRSFTTDDIANHSNSGYANHLLGAYPTEGTPAAAEDSGAGPTNAITAFFVYQAEGHDASDFEEKLQETVDILQRRFEK